MLLNLISQHLFLWEDYQMEQVTLKERIVCILQGLGRPASIKEITEHVSDKPSSTVRGRLNENVDIF